MGQSPLCINCMYVYKLTNEKREITQQRSNNADMSSHVTMPSTNEKRREKVMRVATSCNDGSVGAAMNTMIGVKVPVRNTLIAFHPWRESERPLEIVGQTR
ncbi:hypothetical protein PoB_005767700 [Plakobranchus ocellatus]|uniref:Uncharacterized protein n=1 Tax=Plakobranchus ocellatus TaxID=259542 RepID=A0AAV4CIK3_9GAST|nr:hypothetical protein PoB_005767700 [Plakobranchus ocellatus]